MDKKPISAKIPENLYLEIQRTGKGTTECVIEGLELLFSNSQNAQQEAGNNTTEIQAIIQEKERLIAALEDNNKVLKTELSLMHGRYDNLTVKLLGSPGQHQAKKWWEIWK